MQFLGGLFGGGGGRGGTRRALGITLLVGTVVDRIATIDEDRDGKIEPHEIANAARDVVSEAMRTFPEYAHIAGDPLKVQEIIEHVVRIVQLATDPDAKPAGRPLLGDGFPGGMGQLPS